MDIQDIYRSVMLSKNYRSFDNDTVMNICEEEIKKYKTREQVIKAVKNKLYQSACSFFDENDTERAFKLLSQLPDACDLEILQNICLQILSLHTSTYERIEFFGEFYRDIFNTAGKISSVIDIACGFNPFVLPFLPDYKKICYYACDINDKLSKLLNNFFLTADIRGEAKSSNILFKIPDIKADIAFIFKFLPLLELQKKGYGRILLEKLDCTFLAVSFPTKSISGKGKGMADNYANFFNELIRDKFLIIFEKQYKNELLFIIKKLKGK